MACYLEALPPLHARGKAGRGGRGVIEPELDRTGGNFSWLIVAVNGKAPFRDSCWDCNGVMGWDCNYNVFHP